MLGTDGGTALRVVERVADTEEEDALLIRGEGIASVCAAEDDGLAATEVAGLVVHGVVEGHAAELRADDVVRVVVLIVVGPLPLDDIGRAGGDARHGTVAGGGREVERQRAIIERGVAQGADVGSGKRAGSNLVAHLQLAGGGYCNEDGVAVVSELVVVCCLFLPAILVVSCRRRCRCPCRLAGCPCVGLRGCRWWVTGGGCRVMGSGYLRR